MSSNSPDSDFAGILALYETFRPNTYCTVATAVFLVYDALVTMDREVECFWRAKGRITGPKVLFFTNRFTSLLPFVLHLMQQMQLSDESCTYLARIARAFDSAQFFPSAGFSALRVHVLSGNNMPISILVFILGLVPFGVNMVALFVHNYGEAFAGIGCMWGVDVTSQTNIRMILISRIPLIVSDTILILITWWSPMTRNMRGKIHSGTRRTLDTIIVQNGTVYFVVLLCLNVIHLAFSFDNIVGDGNRKSLIPAFTAPITTVLTSHFLLQLQEAHRRTVKVDSDDVLNIGVNSGSTPSFVAQVIGSIGSELRFSEHEDEGSAARNDLEHAACTDVHLHERHRYT